VALEATVDHLVHNVLAAAADYNTAEQALTQSYNKQLLCGHPAGSCASSSSGAYQRGASMTDALRASSPSV
jgi:hypothetical protein